MLEALRRTRDQDRFGPADLEFARAVITATRAIPDLVFALIFVLTLDKQNAINFQLLGGVWILQTFPAIVFSLYTRWFHKWALLAGWAVSMVYGTWAAYNVVNPTTGKHFGGSLAEIPGLGEMGYTGVDEARVIEILRALLSALRYAHAHGVVHRDVKAENVLFDDTESPLLADFGIALRRGFGPRVTAAGLAVGSTAYMAPEQARGEDVDGRADLYSLGVLAWEMLSGHLPYQAGDALSMAVMHAQDPIPKLPPRLRHWQRFMNRALAKHPGERFHDVAQMSELRRRTGMALAAGQNEGLLFRFRDMIQAGAVDFVHGEGLLMAPTIAVPEMLARNGLSLQDFDFYELHEAFAAQVLCTLRAWESEEYCRNRLGLEAPLGRIDPAKINPNGSSLATGHPFAATGARIVATAAKHLKAIGGGRCLVSICTAGGMGVVAILER